jgi:predicted HNH restriction endonuclease
VKLAETEIETEQNLPYKSLFVEPPPPQKKKKTKKKKKTLYFQASWMKDEKTQMCKICVLFQQRVMRSYDNSIKPWARMDPSQNTIILIMIRRQA